MHGAEQSVDSKEHGDCCEHVACILNVVEAAADAQRALAHGVIIEAGAELLASEALHATGVALRTEPCIILMWAYVGAVMVEGPEAWPCACDNACMHM